jgi:hypothetical protein
VRNFPPVAFPTRFFIRTKQELEMSRTKKGSKSPGWDYWGKRPLGYGAGGRPSGKRKEKQNGIQRERSISKRELNRVKAASARLAKLEEEE